MSVYLKEKNPELLARIRERGFPTVQALAEALLKRGVLNESGRKPGPYCYSSSIAGLLGQCFLGRRPFPSDLGRHTAELLGMTEDELARCTKSHEGRIVIVRLVGTTVVTIEGLEGAIALVRPLGRSITIDELMHAYILANPEQKL